MRIITLFLLALTTASLYGQQCPADFSYLAPSCNEVSFKPNSLRAGTYKWSFGDGHTSTEASPTHVYDLGTPGTYTYDVTLITGGSCVPDTVTRQVTVSASILPDASIESVGIYNFVNCAPTDDHSYELVINNTSSSKPFNSYYTIDWGDGTAPYAAEDLPDGTAHTYYGVGLYDIVVSVQGIGGCWSRDTFPFFYGSNPGGNIVPVSNQIACVPEDVHFRISGTEQNPPGTTYKLWVNDGLGDTTYFNHPPPDEYVYHLTKSPCESSETSSNYFNIYFEATNPCFTQSGGTIIRANKVPIMDFTADETTCAGGIVEIRNESEPALYAVGNGCSFDMLTQWVISADPSQYEIVSGSLTDEDGLDIRFFEPGEYTVTLHYTPRYSNACSSPPMSKDICVLGPPEAGFTAENPDAETCTPLTLQLTNTSTTAVECGDPMEFEWLIEYLPGDCGATEADYTLLGGGSSADPALTDRNVNIRFDASGHYRLGLVATNACGTDTTYQTYTVTEAPRLALEEIPDTCMAGPVSIRPVLDMNFDCSDPPVYAWDFGGGTGGDPTAADPGPVTFDRPGTYTISVTVANNCGTATTSETFEVFGPASLPTITVTDETCETTSIVATLESDGTGISFHWTGPEGFEAHTASWERPRATPAMSGDYTVVATNAEGCSATATYSVYVEPGAPIEVEAGDADVCIGEPVTLRATGGATYTWTGDHLSGSTGSEVVFQHDVAGDYRVVVYGTDPAGRCDAYDTVTVRVHDYLPVDAGPDREACVDQPIELEGSPGRGRGKRGVWSGEFVQPDGTFLADRPGTYTLTYTYTSDAGCSASDETTVCVRPTPVARFTIDPTDACEATGLILRPVNLTNDLDACSPAEVLWTVTPDADDCGSPGYAFIAGTSPSSREPVIQFTRTDGYTVTLTVASSCGVTSSSTHSERVMILGVPTFEIAPVDTLCGAQEVAFTVEREACSSPVTTYVWSFPTASTPSTHTGPTPPPVHYGSGTHTISVTAFTACGATTEKRTFTVLEPPVTDFSLPGGDVCADERFTIGGTYAGDALSFRWTASHPGISFSDAAAAHPEVSLTGVPAGTYELYVTATSPACTAAEQRLSFTVRERPGISLQPVDDACEAITFTPVYDLGSPAPGSVRWALSDGSTTTVLATTADPGSITVDRPGTYTLSLYAANACGDSTVARTFTVTGREGIELVLAEDTYCHDGNTTVTIENNSTAAVEKYRWTVRNADNQIYIRSRDAAPTFTFGPEAAPGTYHVAATVQTPVCGEVEWDTLITLLAPPAAEIAPIDLTCADDSFDPAADYGDHAGNIDSVRWTFPAGSLPLTATDRDPGPVRLTTYGSDLTVALRLYSACGETVVTRTFDRPAPPTVALTLSDTAVCTGGTVTVANTSTTGLMYEWTADPVANVTVSDPTAERPEITFGDTPGRYTLRARVTDGACLDTSVVATVVVEATPVVTITELPDGCGITSIEPKVTYGGDPARLDSIRWTLQQLSGADAGAVLYTGGPRTAPLPLNGPATYAFVATAFSRCAPAGVTARDTFTVNEPPRPDLELESAIRCPGEDLTVRDAGGNAPDRVTFSLYAPDGSLLATRGGSAVTFPMGADAAPGDYLLRQEVDNGACGVGRRDTTVSVRPRPALRLEPLADACAEATVTPRATFDHVAAYDSLHWSFPGADRQSARGPAAPELYYGRPGTYTVTLIGYAACGTDTATVSFTVDPRPEIAFGPRDTVCYYDGTYLLAAPQPAGGSWSDARGRAGVVTPTGAFDPARAGTGTHELLYTYTSGACTVTASHAVVVIERPEIRLTATTLEVCETESRLVLDNGRPTGGWYSGPGVTDPAGVMDPSALGAGSYTLTYHYRPEGMSCENAVDFTVQVSPRPAVHIAAADEACAGDPVSFAAEGGDATSYVWREGDNPPVRRRTTIFTFSTPGIHAVQLTATNAAGCATTVVKQVRVSAPPEAYFTGAGERACAGEDYRFTNRSVSAGDNTTYHWDFGNGETSRLEQPGGVRYAGGRTDTTYTVSLRVTNDCGSATYRMPVRVTPAPVAAFSLSDTTGCSDLQVRFANQSTGSGLRYAWYVDGEHVSGEATPPAYTFVADGTRDVTYDVLLVVTDGCAGDSLRRQVTVRPRALDVRFDADVLSGCGPLTVDFRNLTESVAGVSYAWDFGDGMVSTEEHPRHTFRNPDATERTFTVTLTADNGCARERFQLPVRVHPAPQVSFAAATESCAGSAVSFRRTSGNVTDLRWDFGDGTTVKGPEAPEHTYATAGTYTVTLTGTVPGADCPATYTREITVRELPAATFVLDNSQGCAPLQVQPGSLAPGAGTHLWDFGDGNTAVGNRPAAHTYTVPGEYAIRLTVRDDYGCSRDTVYAPVRVHALPEAAFTAEADRACGLPQQVCFTNTSEGAAGYAWDFGNGNTTGINAPCETFTEAGTYNVRLVATSAYGCTAEAAAPLAVYGEPVAEFSIPDTAGCTAGEMPFASVSRHTDYIRWTFSDGFATDEANFTRRFDDPGSYDVTVIAGNGSGCADTLVARNFVEVYPRPFADFDVDNAAGQPMNTLQFTDRSSNDAAYFGWDFGDGHGSGERDPMHRYLSSVDKTVWHWVENTYGCRDTVSKPVDLDQLIGLFIHNIFTPDDNSVEEQNIFKPKGIGLEDFYIGVYTRTGQLVWESDALDEEGAPTESWDGSYQGRPAKPGTYVWRVHRAKFRNGRNWSGMPNERGVIAKTGYITLLR